MCIAIASMKGTPIPSDKILENCFTNNPDGAGFAYADRGEVVIRKGFMKFKDFLEAIHKADKEHDLTAKGVLIHTRITTHGGTNPAMTHPFPICADEGALKKLVYRSPYAVIHNGIISLTSAEATKKGNMSDTAVFVEKYLSKIARNKRWFNNPSNIELIEELIDSKMAILNANGDIIMTSGFTKDEDDGNYYSNTSYLDNYCRYYSKLTKPYSWNRAYGYGDYYDWEDDRWYDTDYKGGSYNYKRFADFADFLKKEGYERSADGYWVKKDKKEDSPIYKSLMKLKEDEIVLGYTDGEAIEYQEEEHFYLTDTGEIYSSFKTPKNDRIIDTQLHFYDYGEIFDINFYPKDFREDCIISTTLLDDEDSMTEKEEKELAKTLVEKS